MFYVYWFCLIGYNFLISTKITYLFGIIPRNENFLLPKKHKSHPKKRYFRIAKQFTFYSNFCSKTRDVKSLPL